MNRLAALKHEHEYFLPSHPKASGKATIYIEGYPSEDGKPMGETDFQIRQILTLNYQLQAVFGLEGQVYVGADSFVYYEEGDPSKCVAPDVYVVFGVDAIPARPVFIHGLKEPFRQLLLNSGQIVQPAKTARKS